MEIRYNLGWNIGWKTLREKEKFLVTGNFSFSHNVFHGYISLLHQNVVLCGNGFKHVPNGKGKKYMYTYRISQPPRPSF